MYNFNEWVNAKDLNESPLDWAKKAGRALGNWWQSPPAMVQQANPQQQAPVQQKRTVGFSAADLNNVRVAMVDYLGIISRYMTFVQKQLGSNPRLLQSASNAFEKGPAGAAYNQLRQWINWIKETTAQVGTQNEAVFLEGIKINYKNFEQMKYAMQKMSSSMRNWVAQVAKSLPPEQAQALQSNYDQYVVVKQGALAKQLLWLDRKLQKLMARNNIPYQGIV